MRPRAGNAHYDGLDAHEDASAAIGADGVFADPPDQETSAGGRSANRGFPVKLYNIVDDPATDNLICWSESGNSFLVPSPDNLGREILPQYFKHGNFGSFVRQLNMYGFHKVPHLRQGVMRADPSGESEILEFANPYFKRGEERLLAQIKRKKPPTDHPAAESDAAASLTSEVQLVRRNQDDLSAHIQQLYLENRQLRESQARQQETLTRIGRFLSAVFGNQFVGALTGGTGTYPANITGPSDALAPTTNNQLWPALNQSDPDWASRNNFDAGMALAALKNATSYTQRHNTYDHNPYEPRVHSADDDDNIRIAEVESDSESPTRKRPRPLSSRTSSSRSPNRDPFAGAPALDPNGTPNILQKWTPPRRAPRMIANGPATPGSASASTSNVNWPQFLGKNPTPEEIGKFLAVNDPAVFQELQSIFSPKTPAPNSGITELDPNATKPHLDPINTNNLSTPANGNTSNQANIGFVSPSVQQLQQIIDSITRTSNTNTNAAPQGPNAYPNNENPAQSPKINADFENMFQPYSPNDA